jgi:membrane-associated phospholipid phosphatase
MMETSGGAARPGNGWLGRVSSFVTLVRGRPVVLAVGCLTGLFLLVTLLILRADLRPTGWDVVITRELQQLPGPAYLKVGVFGAQESVGYEPRGPTLPTAGDLLIAVSAPGFAPWNWLLALAVLLFMLWRRWYTEAAFTVLAALGGLLAEVVKNVIDRPRPTPDLARVVLELHSYSFPSGHVTGYVTMFGFLFYLAYTLLPRASPLRWAILGLLALGIVLVGPSRVYMGQHWASDALGGYALGFAYLLVVIQAHRAWLLRHPRAAPASGAEPGRSSPHAPGHGGTA